MLFQLDSKNFDESIKSGLKLVVFTAKWCSFCQKLLPELNKVALNGYWIGELDVDKNTSLVQVYEVNGFPTIFIFNNGKLIGSIIGYQTSTEILANLKRYS